MLFNLTEEGPRTRSAYKALRTRVLGIYPGVPLPPVSELLREMEVSRATLDKVFDLMGQQGLIERKSRKGVFASDPLKGTGEISIVLSQADLAPDASPFFGVACSLLKDNLHEANPKWAVKLHLGAAGSDGPGPLDLLDPTVLPRLRGVLNFHPLYDLNAKLAEAGVPVVHLNRKESACGDTVSVDNGRLLQDGVRKLAEAGCRRVSLLHTRYLTEPKPQGPDLIQGAATVAAECGAAFKDEWIGCEQHWSERHGYELFMRAWDRPSERPDGILVADDILCRGVLRAIQCLRLEFPTDLRLVTHANRGIELPYHRPVSRLEFDVPEWMNKAADLLKARIRGLPLETTNEVIRAKWIKGETT